MSDPSQHLDNPQQQVNVLGLVHNGCSWRLYRIMARTVNHFHRCQIFGGSICTGKLYNIPGLKFHIIKFNKGKIRLGLRETYSKLDVGKRYPSRNHLMCLWLKGNWQRQWLRH